MSNNNQSSVEYLIKEFSEILGPISTNPMQDLLLMDAMKQAKSMHKQEVIKAFDFGDYNIDLPDGTWEQKYKSAEQYYNETFGK